MDLPLHPILVHFTIALVATSHTGGDLMYKHGAETNTTSYPSHPIAQSLHGG